MTIPVPLLEDADEDGLGLDDLAGAGRGKLLDPPVLAAPITVDVLLEAAGLGALDLAAPTAAEVLQQIMLC